MVTFDPANNRIPVGTGATLIAILWRHNARRHARFDLGRGANAVGKKAEMKGARPHPIWSITNVDHPITMRQFF
jgi:hypothetical protein